MRMRFTRLCAGMLLAGLGAVAAADPVELTDRMQLADGLFRRSLFDLAAREYAALAETPDAQALDDVLFRLGECYRRLKKLPEAEAAYKRLVESFPASRNAPRARLQRALILMESGGASLEEAAASFAKLSEPSVPAEVRAAALYHGGETLEKLKRPDEALARYEVLVKAFVDTDYGMYAGLRTAWLLTRRNTAEDRRRALGIYLDLAHKAKEAKVVEEASYFAAQVSLLDGRHEESANLFLALRTKFPDSPRVTESALAAAWANYYAGRYKEASELLERVIGQAQHPDREEILYVKANCLRQLEQRADAVAMYARQLTEFPAGKMAPLAQYERLSTLYNDGKYQEVLEVAAQVAAPPPEYADNVYWMSAESAVAVQKSEAAVQNYRLLVDKCPASPFVKDALYRLGWLLQKQEAWESAASWFQQVSERFPKDPLAAKALYAAGVCRSRLGQSEAALRDWTALLTQYPESAEVAETLYQKAMEELRAKNPRAAGATLDERMRRFPDDARKAEVLYWRGAVARQTGDRVEAEKLFRACLAATPAKEFERESMLELGLLLQEDGRKEEAAGLFQTLLDAPITDKLGPDRLAWLAEFQLEQKRLDAAAKAANALLALKPDKGWVQTAWTVLGRIHRAKEERDPAIHAFTEALSAGASTAYGAEAALRLGELLTQAGRFDEAAKHLNDAASRAAAPELLGLRAHAYAGLARNAEEKGDAEAALRYYMSVGILFNDATLVPEALHKAATLLDKLGRGQEAQAMREELKARYPDSPLSRQGQTRTERREEKGNA
ncbi:MAG: tetratricopeptide repeat protein [Kiritimatiellia bacterium]|nr:tetratricopeptide repeat protein [Kiritimatiellia bacterium]MDD4440415.1 tetratricopeptide repeat protein [Kiritimatiellia bacterium]MDX9792540.1 tetratricopeptide repeat protein [Kiritimatiellia bacterium]NLC81403.1 tetratricopeptide repeat protein [Lentisphaerota bacterium]